MIQSAPIKPIETKAKPLPSKVSTVEKPKSSPDAKKADSVKSEDSDFAKELESASTEKSAAPEKSEVTESKQDQSNNTEAKSEKQAEPKAELAALLMSSPVIASELEGDMSQVKIFDPALTQDVDALVQPQIQLQVEAASELSGEQVMKLAEGQVEEVKTELSQDLLKYANIAKEEVKAEVQLPNTDDFIQTKNMAKKPQTQNAYGMMKNPAAQKEAAAVGLALSQIVKELPSSESKNESVNSQQFILNMMSDKPKLNESATAQKVFDMSQIKTDDANGIMNQISDYIVQAKAAKEPTVNMRVNHDQLGMIDITVSKAGGMNADTVAISIGAHSAEGKNFFQTNSKDLFSHLNSVGISVADFKVENGFNSQKNDFDMSRGDRNNENAAGGKQQFASEQNQRRHDQDRRKDLWDLLSKEAA